MVDEKRVRLGLSCCMDSMKDDPFRSCPKCPYNTVDVAVQDCRRELSREALELIEVLWKYAALNTYDPPVEGQACPPPPLPDREPMTVESTISLPYGKSKLLYGICPSCSCRITNKDHPHFCGFCGEAVRWIESEDVLSESQRG